MGYFLASAIFFVAAVYGASGQTCSSSLPNECYYTGAGTISAGSANSNMYFAIGGLFDVHERDSNAFCGSKISSEGMINLLAFYWSINRYSNEILQGRQMSVGAVAFDNCMRPDQTIENVLSFSHCKIQVHGLSQQNLVAYVGPYSNVDADRTAMLAEDLKITIVSPGASSMGLKRENHHDTLLRVRPSRAFDIKAIHAFLKHQNAEFVLIVHSKDYQDAYEEMERVLKDRPLGSNPKLCHQMEFTLEDDASDDYIKEVATMLIDYRVAKYVVPLVSKKLTQKIMAETEKESSGSRLIYILNSEIGRDMTCVTQSTIVVEPALPTGNDFDVLKDFNDFLKNVNANATQFGRLNRLDVVNPWLSAIENNMVTLPDVMDNSTASPMVMNAWRTIFSVKVIINGIHQGILNKCAQTTIGYQFCDELRNVPDHEDDLYEAIKGIYFGDDGQLKNPMTTYSYYVYSVADHFVNIGSIAADHTDAEIKSDVLHRPDFRSDFSGSLCPDEIGCCHEPTDAPDTTSVDTTTTPQTATTGPSDSINVLYPSDKEITGAFSNMDRDSDDYGTRFDLNQKWIIALGVLAGLGCLCVLVFEVYILYKMVGKKVDNKWRTMWLGQLLLFGIFLSYLVCFAFLFIPTKATCGITRFGVGVAYATCFAVLLVKLMVILTSKNSEVLLPGDGDSPNYLKGVYQFLMFVFAVGVQIVINVQWLITVPPEAIKVMSNSGEQVWICNHYTWKTGDNMLDMESFVRTNFENHLISLTYIMVMILIITILSLNAHGIITNHRESVFIGIAAGFSIPLWLAWGLVGGLNKEKDYGHEFGDACIAFGLFCTATLILFAMFLPKVRQLGNMGVEGIYLEDDRDTIYGGSIIMAPPSYKSKGGAPSSVIYVNNQGIYSEPVVVGNGDSNKMATYLKHPMSTYSAPPTYLKKTESTYGGSRVLRVTDDLKGRHPSNRSSTKKPLSEVNFSSSGRPRSQKGTLPRSRSQSDLGAL